MNSPSTQTNSFPETLASYLEGLADEGVREIELTHPFPVEAPAPPPPRPRQQPAPVPAREITETKPLLPKTAVPEAVVTVAADKLVWCTLVRMAECGDRREVKDSTVALVTEEEETQAEHGNLLREILRAAGYSFLSAPLHLTSADDLKGAGVRILVMGNSALQKISPAGMDLKIVRGMWQDTPYGKLIPTFPPSVLPENPAGKKAVWQDLKRLLQDLELEIPDWTKKKLAGR